MITRVLHTRPPEEELEQVLKRVKTDHEFVKQNLKTCEKLHRALEKQIQSIEDEKEEEQLEKERQEYKHETSEETLERSNNHKNWIEETNIEFARGLCALGGDCWYEGNLGRTSGFSLFRLPGYEYMVCDVCFHNQCHEYGHFSDWLESEVQGQSETSKK